MGLLLNSESDTSLPRAAYSIAETCEMLNLSPAQLYREIAAGRIVTAKCGRRRLVPADEPGRYMRALIRAAAK